MGATKIERLRKKYEQGNIHIVDLIRYLDPTKNKILTDILAEELINNSFIPKYGELEEKIEHRYNRLKNSDVFFDDADKDLSFLSKNYLMAHMLLFLVELMEERGQLNHVIRQFNKYWEEKKIPHNYFNQPRTLQDIKNTVSDLDMIIFEKNAHKQSYKIHESNDWLIVVPLSLKASRIYGANTKWCTAATDDNRSYFEVTEQSLLVYLINKRINEKFAYKRHASLDERGYAGRTYSEFYNELDYRIDSVDLNIPFHILLYLKNFTQNKPAIRNQDFTNYNIQELQQWRDENMKKQGRNELAGEPDAPDEPIVGRVMEAPPRLVEVDYL